MKKREKEYKQMSQISVLSLLPESYRAKGIALKHERTQTHSHVQTHILQLSSSSLPASSTRSQSRANGMGA